MSTGDKDFFSVHEVKGRKEYRCSICRKPICKGVTHTTVSQGSAGVYTSTRSHSDCYAAATAPAPLLEEISS
jgi:hypothetical protein